MKDEEIARSLQIGSATVERVRRRRVPDQNVLRGGMTAWETERNRDVIRLDCATIADARIKLESLYPLMQQ